MKKLLLMPLMVTALFTGANADDSITQTLTILPSAVVQFGTPIAAGVNTGGTDKFIDYTINFGSKELGTSPSHQVNVYVQTNVEATKKVQMTITDDTHAGKLATTDAAAVDIDMAYAFGFLGSEVAITLGTAFDLTTGANNGGTAATGATPATGSVGSFTATPTLASDQLAGVYGTTLAVAIRAL